MKRTCSQSSFPPQFGRTCSISGNSGREILPSAGRSSRLCEHCALGSHIEARMPSSMKKPADEDPQPDRQTLKTGARRHLTVSPRFPVPIVGGTLVDHVGYEPVFALSILLAAGAFWAGGGLGATHSGHFDAKAQSRQDYEGSG